LAGRIAGDIFDACQPHWCTVTVIQKPRGGIKITATAKAGPKTTQPVTSRPIFAGT
jgi:7-cyano-7-deazaguanine reductase